MTPERTQTHGDTHRPVVPDLDPACVPDDLLMHETVLRQVFDNLDADKNGVLEVRPLRPAATRVVECFDPSRTMLLFLFLFQASDVRQGLQMLGLPSSEPSLRSFLRKLDKDEDDRVSYVSAALTAAAATCCCCLCLCLLCACAFTVYARHCHHVLVMPQLCRVCILCHAARRSAAQSVANVP